MTKPKRSLPEIEHLRRKPKLRTSFHLDVAIYRKFQKLCKHYKVKPSHYVESMMKTALYVESTMETALSKSVVTD
jgi:hypothetical protein